MELVICSTKFFVKYAHNFIWIHIYGVIISFHLFEKPLYG